MSVVVSVRVPRELKEEAERLGERLVAVFGVRRIGKSSLVKVALKEASLPYVLVDVRDMYYSENIVTVPYLNIIKGH